VVTHLGGLLVLGELYGLVDDSSLLAVRGRRLGGIDSGLSDANLLVVDGTRVGVTVNGDLRLVD
jgi:hypothetical protein